ncbi:putative feruloyl esterase [Helianthus annuus]|uniref:Feruloyl esterase n=1 Tax=Helianthus annuus TaxID=4232 RepID=A0A251V9E9_HELAN|nr:putative uncharacterized protein YDL057W isoform X1 [Helianthus annuus]KAF5815297.1 putative feruloyl esterase [Helianthus annuus]KAJ0593786.1 putative feruloyl esterase [Helianthus annuus]KAJ0608811.1 putative feruloyl esterase [Helianthus annuus]KAJ0774595.1 putative feruloyl esterase [Helianthus annuus]KAJ0936631.1 putative feruloyl esterase [Helianthus annuus]
MMGRSNSTPEDCNLFSAVEIQHQKMIIQNSYNEKLVGILHETGSKEVVIVCHGYRSCKDRIPMVNLAATFATERISAFRFDFAGNGESEGLFQYGNYHREVDDLRAVIQYFEHEKRSVAAIIGHSKGGNVVLLYASRFNDVHNVVNISGRFDLKRGIEGRLGKDYLQRIKKYGFIHVANRKGNIEYRVTEESLMDRLTTGTCAACQLIPQNCRVLSIHGSADKIVPMEDAMEFAKHISNHKLHIITGADHEYTCHQNELASIVLDFVKSGSSHDMATAAKKSLRSSL